MAATSDVKKVNYPEFFPENKMREIIRKKNSSNRDTRLSDVACHTLSLPQPSSPQKTHTITHVCAGYKKCMSKFAEAPQKKNVAHFGGSQKSCAMACEKLSKYLKLKFLDNRKKGEMGAAGEFGLLRVANSEFPFSVLWPEIPIACGLSKERDFCGFLQSNSDLQCFLNRIFI